MDLVRTIRAQGVDAEFLLWSGAAADGIAEAAASEAAEIIVVGTRGRRGAGRMLLGSVSGRLIGAAVCPSWSCLPTPGPCRADRRAADRRS